MKRKRLRKPWRNSIRRLVLEKLSEAGGLMFDAVFPRQYSYTRFWREVFGVDVRRKVRPRTLSSTLSRLKRDGLVVYTVGANQRIWKLTRQGIRWVNVHALPPAPVLPAEDGNLRVVVFDISERERNKRDALRAELIGRGFERLQKSVWIGRRPLGEDFLRVIDDLGLEGKVHIFMVQKEGTLN